MNQKFSQQRKPWFQLPGCLMSHSMLVNNIPYHSCTTIYSQNQDPPPSSLRRFHHPPRETPPKAERVAHSSSGSRNLFPPLSPVFLLPSPLASRSLSPLFLCIVSLNPFGIHFFFSLPALPLHLRDRWKHKRSKEGKKRERKTERERESERERGMERERETNRHRGRLEKPN